MRKILTFLMAVMMCTQITFADTNGDLQKFFNGLGFAGHANNPTSYSSQAAGYTTFGSIYERSRVEDVQIMHVDVPGYRSGCGGIDLFAGGFSFIDSGQLVKFMQSVLSSGAGYALNLSLEVELPEVAHALQYMQTLANKINSGNFNSCEMGEDLVGGLWPKNRASQQQICQDIGTNSGHFSDWAKARQGCSTGGEIDSQLDAAKKSDSYKYRVYKNTNLIWDRVIERNDFLSKDQKLAELYMSISGTVVFTENSSDPKKQTGSIETYGSKVTNSNFIKALLYGGQIPTYSCDDASSGKCLKISYSPSNFQEIKQQDSLVAQVKGILNDIYDNIKADHKLSDKDLGLIQITQSPVFSILSADAQDGVGVQGIDTFAQMIATDLLAQYLSTALNVIQDSLSGTQLDNGNVQALFKSIQQAQTFVNEFDDKTRAKFQQALSMNLEVQALTKQAMLSLTPALRNAMQSQETA